jgi:hypothetical protein
MNKKIIAAALPLLPLLALATAVACTRVYYASPSASKNSSGSGVTQHYVTVKPGVVKALPPGSTVKTDPSGQKMICRTLSGVSGCVAITQVTWFQGGWYFITGANTYIGTIRPPGFSGGEPKQPMTTTQAPPSPASSPNQSSSPNQATTPSPTPSSSTDSGQVAADQQQVQTDEQQLTSDEQTVSNSLSTVGSDASTADQQYAQEQTDAAQAQVPDCTSVASSLSNDTTNLLNGTWASLSNSDAQSLQGAIDAVRNDTQTLQNDLNTLQADHGTDNSNAAGAIQQASSMINNAITQGNQDINRVNSDVSQGYQLANNTLSSPSCSSLNEAPGSAPSPVNHVS